MHAITKRLAVLMCAVTIALLPAASSSFAASENKQGDFTTEKMAVDLVAIRPLGIVSTVAGGVLYVLSLPFSIPGGNAPAVWESTVVKPAKFTFVRPLGDF
jgi:hypothetical protein